MFSKKRFFASFFLVVILFLSGFVVVAAADPLVPCGAPGQHSCTICDFFEMTRRVTNYIIFGVIPVLTAFFLLLGGGYLVWSKGDPGALVSAKNVITVAVIGFLVIFVGWVFVNTMFMALGIADWDGFKLNESWWKISTKCSQHDEISAECGDGIWQVKEGCDPNMTVEACQARGGYSIAMCNEIIAHCDPLTCKSQYCGNGVVDGDEKCDYNESLAACKIRNPASTDQQCIDFKNMCDQKCKIIVVAACEGVDKAKVGKGCWLTNDMTDREKYCQRGKYICDTEADSPTYNKVVCKPLTPKLVDECCFNRGDNLDTTSFDIVRIRDFVKLGDGSGGQINNMMVPCESQAIDCDSVCAKKGQVCIGVGLANWQKSKCVSVVHHVQGDCSLSQNLVTNDCRAKYCLTTAVCCEGGECKDNLKPCCDPNVTLWDPWARIYFKGSGSQFSVGETACYCK